MSKGLRIGLTGISTSGKTTIASMLSSEFHGRHIKGDHFFKNRYQKVPKCEFHGQIITNLENPDATNWEKFAQTIKESSSLTFVDSFQLRVSPLVEQQIDAIIQFEYQETDLPIAVIRRVVRRGNPPPPENYHEIDPLTNKLVWRALYYEEVVWRTAIEHPEYWKYNEGETDKPLLILSATAPLEENIKLAREFVANLLAQQKDSK